MGTTMHVPPSLRLVETPPAVWRPAADMHCERVLSLLHGRVPPDDRHPVFNFIFTYYRFDPKLLQRYSPGTGKLLTGVAVREPKLWMGRGWSPGGDGAGRSDG